VHALAVPEEDVMRLDTAQPPRGKKTKQRMQRKPLAGDAQLGNRAERVSANEDPRLLPPERDLLPEPALADEQELEGRALDPFPRHDVMRHAEPSGERRAVAVVPIEELDHPGRLARGTHSLLDSLPVDRIQEPEAAVHDENMRAPEQELLDDPPEAVRTELVAKANLHT
jgi:hypothetical protein